MKKPVFLVAAPSYTNESGGAMVLHYLCHLLNETAEAYVVPMPRGSIINWLNIDHVEKLVASEKNQLANFKTCPSFSTPIFSSYPGLDLEACVAVYPEVVLGNPFQIKNVARWVLYHSGFHRGVSCTSNGEVEFKYKKEFAGAEIAGFSETADLTLKVNMVDEDTYNTLQSNYHMSREELIASREGVAYCVRKGKFRDIGLINGNSICIDGKSNAEVRKILNQVKYFISFDPHTSYSNIAVAYGCYSLISHPEYDGIEEACFEQRPAVAFSESQLEKSWDNRPSLLARFNESITVSKAM